MDAPEPRIATRYPLDAEGVWCEVRRPRAGARAAAALFLDRDGTLIELVHYLSRPDAVRPIPAAGALIAAANRLGIPVVVVTNQSGIGRGYYGWADFAAVQRRVEAALAAQGGRLDAVYACPHPPDARRRAPGDQPPCRKPNPGMLRHAARDLDLDLGASWIAGDAASDLEAGKRAGLARGWLVPTGYGARDEATARALAGAGFEVVTGRPIDALAAELPELAR